MIIGDRLRAIREEKKLSQVKSRCGRVCFGAMSPALKTGALCHVQSAKRSATSRMLKTQAARVTGGTARTVCESAHRYRPGLAFAFRRERLRAWCDLGEFLSS